MLTLAYKESYSGDGKTHRAGAHGFNAKIGFKNYSQSPKILAKTSANMPVWFGDINFGIFWLISWVSVHSF